MKYENINKNTKSSSESIVDENYIDRSLEENQIRDATGNSYYTINTSLKLSEDRVYEVLQITNSRLVRIDKEWYSFTCNLTNTSSNEYSGRTFEVKFLNKKVQIHSKEEDYNSTITHQNSGTLSITTQKNILDSYDFKIVRTGDYVPMSDEYFEIQE